MTVSNRVADRDLMLPANLTKRPVNLAGPRT